MPLQRSCTDSVAMPLETRAADRARLAPAALRGAHLQATPGHPRSLDRSSSSPMVAGMPLSKATYDALTTLYRGEASAVEAYDRALTKFAGQPEEPTLTQIAAEHREAVRRLDVELEYHGIKAPEGSGAWGFVANAVHTLTSLVNDEVPLQVLQRGEEVGIGEYERAIAAGGFSPEFTRSLNDGLRRCQLHRDQLQGLRDVITTQPNRPMI